MDKKSLSGLSNILLLITNRCNLHCDYCYVRQGTDVMSFEVAKEVIDNIDDGTVVDFFGGEALLEIELLNKIVDYAKEQNRKIVFQLFSNGTRYDEEVKALLAKGVNIGVSYDGTPYAQFYRTHNEDLSRSILENIIRMKKDIKGLGVKCSITPVNATTLTENCEYLYSKGLNFISHFLLREQGYWDEGSIRVLQRELHNYLMPWYLEHLEEVKLDYFDGLLIGKKRDTGCWAGREGVAIDFQGNLYPCQRFLTNGSKYVIGNIREGITDKTFMKYNISNFVGCKHCESFSKCTNVCIASQYEAGLMFKPIKEVCTVTNMLYEEIKVLEPYKDYIEERLLSVYYRKQCNGE